ncbi:endolytic transglycosylase MltG [Actinomyces wuliandei]|uniref:endolytic transglycosylase MltG n=1 Tax=Actinomyces wuliandei TaxID=2057743 RepID=UPI000FDA0BA8|nr:endolytic transglycosylase MltG [Actinomyces wuliandei]
MSQDDFFAELGIQRQDGVDAGHGPRGRRSRRAEKKERRRRRRRRRWLTSVVLVVVLVAVGVVAYQALGVMRDSSSTTSAEDYEGAGEEEVVVTVPEGASGRDIGALLEEADVVASAAAFVEAYKANEKSGSIQPGTYTLKTHMSAANAVATLLDPASKAEHSLTVAEGFTKNQVKERLMSVGSFTEKEVDEAYADTETIGLPEQAGGDVEGWLAPSTYDIGEDDTATDVVAQMVSTTISNLRAVGVKEEDYEEVLTKASIVEREVSQAQYYGQVARVIDNRIADTEGETQGMLQMDSTVLYGLGRVGGIPSPEDTADASNAYNTYQHAGLPPTPIGSPGQEVISAVLDPPEGDWLYFVTVDLTTGETLFATTLEEQEANTEKLNAYCRENREVCQGATATATAAPDPATATPDAGS